MELSCKAACRVWMDIDGSSVSIDTFVGLVGVSLNCPRKSLLPPAPVGSVALGTSSKVSVSPMAKILLQTERVVVWAGVEVGLTQSEPPWELKLELLLLL